MTNPPPPMPTYPAPARPIGALLLFLIFLAIVIAILVDPLNGSNDCAGPLFASPADRANETCALKYDSRMTWFQLMAIPTIVTGCAMVSRWPKYRRAADGSYID